MNLNITWNIIKNNLDKDWDWFWLSRHPNITWKIIQQNPNHPWDWWQISSNPNISWDIIKKHDGVNWDWLLLSRNTMSKIKEEWIHNKRIQIIKANIIKRQWRKSSNAPSYKLGHRLVLERAYDSDLEYNRQTKRQKINES